jgi:chromate transporter
MDRAPLRVIVREWGRIGCLGFGGPAAHIALLRQLVVDRRGWLEADEVEDAIAACNLLPGPASTQLAIFAAWRVGGPLGALCGGLAFILPGLVAILALAAIFLASAPPDWVRGAGAGAGAAVAAVAVQAGWSLAPPSWRRAGRTPTPATSPHARAERFARTRWLAYLVAGALAAALTGPFVVLVLLACGTLELAHRRVALPLLSPAWPALAWVALKVGALSYGGGFVIIPLIQADAVHRHHWLTGPQFLDAVALGQVTPGPVVHTVAAVGYGALGVPGALLAALVAFSPSFAFVLLGAAHFDRLRAQPDARAFLDGAGPAAIGAILGSAVALADALTQPWQAAVLAAAAVALLALRRGVVETLAAAGAAGALIVLAGAPV